MLIMPRPVTNLVVPCSNSVATTKRKMPSSRRSTTTFVRCVPIRGSQQAIRRVAEKRQVPLVDFQNLLREKCQSEFGHACIGGEYFLDHVHPTIDIHRQLAVWILAELQSQSIGWW